MQIQTDSPVEEGLLFIGIPCEQGSCGQESGVRLLTQTGEPVPTWGTPRAVWPDGSLKWLCLHARTPAGCTTLRLEHAEEVHRVALQRRLSGVFRRIYVGCKPGNWKGKLHALSILVRAAP